MNRIERAGKLHVAVKARLERGQATLAELGEEPEVVKLKYPVQQLRQRVEHLVKQGTVVKGRSDGVLTYRLKEDRPPRARSNGAFSVETSITIVKGSWKRMLTRDEARELWQALNKEFKDEMRET